MRSRSRIRTRHTAVAPGPPEIIKLEPKRQHSQQGLGPYADAYPDPISEADKRALQREGWNRSRRDKDDWLWAYGEDAWTGPRALS